LPLSVVVYNQKLDQWKPGAHAGTFRGNQLAMVAGIAALRYTLENRLAERAVELGNRLTNHLKQIQSEVNFIGDVRGRGLMIGVEIVNPHGKANGRGVYPQHPLMARQIQAECMRRGLILELGGRHNSVVRFLPPLIVTAEQIDIICEIFQAAVHAAQAIFASSKLGEVC
jgi:diaminobutyrate-2-oxoglutarate transaminase